MRRAGTASTFDAVGMSWADTDFNPITTSILITGGLDASGFHRHSTQDSREYSWLDDDEGTCFR